MLRTCLLNEPEGCSLVFDAETVAFLESGCALIVGTVMPDGEPFATRGWGLTVLDATPRADNTFDVRLLLDANDAVTLANLAPGAQIAITGADVRTLRSMQCKGRSRGTEPATAADGERARAFCDDFYDAVLETDGTDPALLERLTPAAYAACLVAVDAVFDQTPGPRAGSSLAEKA
jgi:hypothetical protein